MKNVTAALLTRMSTGPYSATAASTRASRSAPLDRSQRTACAVPPASVIRRTTLVMLPGSWWSPSSTVRAQTTTFAPSCA